jgi:hypothetical protein
MRPIRFIRTASLALAASTLACVVSTSHAQNLLANPGFETGASVGAGDTQNIPGWGSFDNAYLTSSPNPAPVGPHSGVGSLKLFSGGVAGVYQTFSASPGQIYNFSGFGLALSSDQIGTTAGGASNFAVMKIVWFDGGTELQPVASDPNLIGSDETDSNPGILSPEITASTATGAWLPYTAQGTAPATTTNVQVLALFVNVGGANANNDSGSAWYDDFSLSQVTVPEPATMSLLLLAGTPLLMRRKRA